MADSPKFYIKGEVVDFEEDLCHEFKGHTNLTASELPPIAVANHYRKAISR